MKIANLACILALILTSCSKSNAACTFEQDVQRYLDANSVWKVVGLENLPDDDQALWNENHHGLCPGMAKLKLDASGDKSFALALIQHTGGGSLEKLVVLRRGKRPSSKDLVPPTKITTPFVVWRAAPGTFSDRETGKEIRILYDSIVFEKMESESKQFYYKGGSFHPLTAAE